SEVGPQAADFSGLGRRLVQIDSARRRGAAGKSERLPNVRARDVVSLGPSDLLGSDLGGEDVRRIHVIVGGHVIAVSDPPGKFAQNDFRGGGAPREVPIK